MSLGSILTKAQQEQLLAEATAEAQRRIAARRHLAGDWREWLTKRFPGYVNSGFAPRHEDFWRWVWAVKPKIRPVAFVGIWPRGGGKSTSTELGVVALGLRHVRRYALYVSGTQEQADKHVATIAALLESAGIERAVNKYGSSKGWRRNRLKTADGFTIDALGLDTTARGLKDEEVRPDVIVLDDVDDRHDTPLAVDKKIETLTTTILPAGSNDVAVMAVQNLIHAGSVFNKLAEKTADFLHDRLMSGPFTALDSFEYELRDGRYTITAGLPSWAGQSIEACQDFINTWGLRAFLRECQQSVKDAAGALWNRTLLEDTRETVIPDLARIVVAIDPEASSGEDSAETGIIVAAKGMNGHGYLLEDVSLRATPNGWATAAVAVYNKYHADRMVAETNNGGEMVANTIETVKGAPVVGVLHASRNKQARAEPIASLYEDHRIHNVGYFPDLEDQLCTWEPAKGMPSPDRLDALVWAFTELDIAVTGAGPGVVLKANAPTPSRFVKSQPTGSRWGRSERRGYR